MQKSKNIIKQIIISVVLLLGIIGINVKAQQEPLYTQYMYNTMSINPAFTGSQEVLIISALSRVQWAGLDGAPRTYNVSAHTPLMNNMGVGISMVSDKFGPVNNFFLNLNYAYRIRVMDNIIMSMGLKAGIYNYTVGLNSLNLEEQGDYAFGGDIEQKLKPNIGAGLYMYSDRWYAGLSLPKMVQTDLSKEESGSALASLKRHYYLMAGYTFDVNQDIKLKPSFINKVVSGAPSSFDLTTQVLYMNKYGVGATYRFGDALAFMANIHVNNQLMVGYSYDFTTSSMSAYNSGSHEIMISYNLDGFLKKEE